jgi:hypothetical protein
MKGGRQKNGVMICVLRNLHHLIGIHRNGVAIRADIDEIYHCQPQATRAKNMFGV